MLLRLPPPPLPATAAASPASSSTVRPSLPCHLPCHQLPSLPPSLLHPFIAGGVLAACLVPQLWKLFRRRSAADISLPFLLIYLLGLAVSFVYLYYEDAIVAWACLVVEIGGHRA